MSDEPFGNLNAEQRAAWTPERIAQLHELWDQGLSTNEIGRRMGISKNAVVGKAHRIGCKPRPSPLKHGPRVRPKPAVRPPHTGVGQCSWPIGHPGEKGFHFCDAPPIEGKPYCAEHHKLAYQRAPLAKLSAPH